MSSKTRTSCIPALIWAMVVWTMPAPAQDFSLPPQIAADEDADSPTEQPRFAFQIDDESLFENPFEDIEFVPDERPASELGAVPG